MFSKFRTTMTIAASAVVLSAGLMAATELPASAEVVARTTGNTQSAPAHSATVFPDYFNLINSSREQLLFQEVTGKMKTYGAPKTLSNGQQQVLTLPETTVFGHASGDVWYEVQSADGVFVGELDLHIDDAHDGKDRATILDKNGFEVTSLKVEKYQEANQGQYLETFEVMDV